MCSEYREVDRILDGAKALRAEGEHERASGECAKALDIAPDYERALVMSAEISAAMGNHDEAISICDKVLELNPESASAYAMRGDARSSKGGDIVKCCGSVHDQAACCLIPSTN